MESKPRVIRVALAGNPNSGKTSVFNLLTGMHQHVGNWPGVTVERKVGRLRYGNYMLELVDLPGTYSLTSYSIEERVARQYILDERPDVIINVVDAANLRRNLDLTMQLLEMGVDLVLDLNMWDEFARSGAKLDLKRLTELVGAPVVTTVAHRSEGKQPILDAVIDLVEHRVKRHRHVPVSYGTSVEKVLVELSRQLESIAGDSLQVPSRYLAAKLLEGDPHIVEIIYNRLPDADVSRNLLLTVEQLREHVQSATGMEPARVISEGRYGFIDGLLREIHHKPPLDRMELSRQLDRILTHRVLGLPLFIGFMWLLFNTTFTLGAYPAGWIESLVGWMAGGLRSVLPEGALSELLTEGVLGGVGSVAVFMPNIMILFLGISILEDSGYMARVAFIMDRVMHLFGLHGKSFIPMLMGFGCTVPAIMATRTLESQRDRTLTALLIPHMSCSARLPVYVLFAGAFFGQQAGNIVMLIYLLGVLVALILGFIFTKTIFRHQQVSFVMELPPYRWPTGWGILIHMWDRSKVYLRKMGGVILVASAVLWILGAYPRNPALASLDDQIVALERQGAAPAEIAAVKMRGEAAAIEYTVIGRLGRVVEPVLAPLGFDWRMGVSLITGLVAKEVVVSSLGVLYQVGGTDGVEGETLSEVLRAPENHISPLAAFAYMIFILLYIPCVASVATIRRELGTRWMVFDIVYQIALAWGAAFLVYQGGRLFGLG
jgi:ferrous iron transport protein B